MGEKRVLVGRFGAPHGVRGEIRVQSFTALPQALASYRPLGDAHGACTFEILAMRPLKDGLFIARLAGVSDRDAAKSLTNVEIYAPRSALPEAEEDEFYLADLIGLSAIDESGARLGRVRDVLDFGGGDILEIAPDDGGETLLLPFTREVAVKVDLAAGQIIVVPPVEVAAEEEDAEGGQATA